MELKNYVFSALCEALDYSGEYVEIDGISDRWAVMLDCGSNEFNGSFTLAKLADEEDSEEEWNTVETYDLSTYWNTPSEVMTLGNDILFEIADEIIECIENN